MTKTIETKTINDVRIPLCYSDHGRESGGNETAAIVADSIRDNIQCPIRIGDVV